MQALQRVGSGRIAYKWIVLSVTTIGALMAAIDSNIVMLALPQMMTSLHADLVEMTWVIMGYILVSTVILLALGRVADMLGRVRMYNLGFITFTVGSILCGVSQSATQLIIARLVQGAGGAMMVVNSAALLTEVFPPDERGRALGINGITFSAGGVLGPVLGGLILSAASWRWIFFINVPIGIVGTLWSFLALREVTPRKTGERFDALGAGAFSLGLLALLGALSLGIGAGWTSAPIIALFLFFAAMAALFIWHERRTASPVLDFSLFRSRAYTFSTLAALMQSLAMFAVNFLIVFYLQAVRGYDPLRAALLLIPMPIVMAVVAPFSGILADRIGARLPATLGVVIQGVTLLGFLLLRADTPYLYIALGLAAMGLGSGLFFSPNTSAAMNAAPRHRLGIASAALAMLRQTGMVISLALAMAVAAGSLPRDDMMKLFIGTNIVMGSTTMQSFVVGMHGAFTVSLALSIVAALLSFVRGKENRQALALKRG
jgi:EmrB/QacA subfamily drug resistance transporter